MPDIFIGSEEVRVVDGPHTTRVPVVAILDPATGLPAFPSGGGGGGGGDATAANQATQITSANQTLLTISSLTAAVGAQADAVAGDDTGASSLMARVKRLSSYLAAISAKLPASLGARAAAESLSITQDTNSTWRIRAYQPTSGLGAVVAIAAATSSPVQAASAGTVIRFGNSGSAPIAIEFGTSGVVATANSLIEIMPGTSEAITSPAGATHFAAFCASATTLKWTAGTGA